jgi:hypothetical protein
VHPKVAQTVLRRDKEDKGRGIVLRQKKIFEKMGCFRQTREDFLNPGKSYYKK